MSVREYVRVRVWVGRERVCQRAPWHLLVTACVIALRQHREGPRTRVSVQGNLQRCHSSACRPVTLT